MTYSLVNRPLVTCDVLEVVEYYKKINPELSKQFLFRLREAKTYINKSPLGFHSA